MRRSLINSKKSSQKMNRIRWTLSAQADLEEIIEYIAQDSISVAMTTMSQIQEEVGRLKEFARQGRIVPELERIGVTTYRELIFHPWRLLHRSERERVYIIAVIDGRRNVEDVLLRRNIR